MRLAVFLVALAACGNAAPPSTVAPAGERFWYCRVNAPDEPYPFLYCERDAATCASERATCIPLTHAWCRDFNGEQCLAFRDACEGTGHTCVRQRP